MVDIFFAGLCVDFSCVVVVLCKLTVPLTYNSLCMHLIALLSFWGIAVDNWLLKASISKVDYGMHCHCQDAQGLLI
eukprot:scaffold457_cov117-Skeletonema_dohrnii-CCMP3373.AAC.11